MDTKHLNVTLSKKSPNACQTLTLKNTMPSSHLLKIIANNLPQLVNNCVICKFNSFERVCLIAKEAKIQCHNNPVHF